VSLGSGGEPGAVNCVAPSWDLLWLKEEDGLRGSEKAVGGYVVLTSCSGTLGCRPSR